MDTYKIGTDIDRVNELRVKLITEIVDLDGISVDYVYNIERINELTVELIKTLKMEL